ncbi:hypothetical protein FH972_023390 [Carpinus fangiana]|uniref:Small-subunit processome Utp12 domain-containing protein n=1 Tax=Carpinus fangiana TaxID=176857 RepID=A0A5N6KV24_9ROSI|nr:hypothetical protein FH972_023390 [Carpinus fangiana]
MSHAANLRLRQAASSTPSKRRKLSDNEPNGVNGLLNGLSSKKLHATPTHDIKNARRKHADESEVAVGRGQEDAEMQDAISIESSSDDEDDEDDEDSDSDASQPQPNGHSSSQALAGIDEPSANAEDDSAEPSFGDLLRSRNDQAPIDVSMTIPDVPSATSSSLQRPAGGALSLATATSLSTVLTQSLRTNDTALLESCLQVPHLDSIRSTIERLAPALASSLLQKLAERMHKRPGRAGSLMVWVQWTVVAHGGYLASQPAAMKQLQTLYNVVKQRATGLQPLLQLKGKLDMLEAQMQLRRNMQVQRTRDEEGVIYVEGEEDEKLELPSGKHARNIVVDDSEMEEDEDDEMPQTLANGLSDEEEDEDEDSDEEDQDLIDDEVEVASADDSDELSDEIDIGDDDDDEDDEDDDEDEVEEVPAKKVKSSRR